MKKMMLMTMMLAASAASAKMGTTQTLAPLAGQSEFSPGLSYIGASYKMENDVSLMNYGSGAITQFKYYYGLTDNHAMGVETGYSSLTFKSTYMNGLDVATYKTTNTGMSDIVLKYKGNYEFPVATLYWSLGHSFSPDKRKSKSISNEEMETNMASGQDANIASVAVVAPVSLIKMGASVEYTDKLDGKEQLESTSGIVTDYTVSNGDSLQTRIFIELEQVHNLNFAIANIRTYGTKSVNESGTSTTESTGSDLLGYELSIRHAVNNNFELIPQLNYYQHINLKDTGIKEAAYAFVGGSARWVF